MGSGAAFSQNSSTKEMSGRLCRHIRKTPLRNAEIDLAGGLFVCGTEEEEPRLRSAFSTEETMRKVLLGVALSVAFTSFASAQTTEFYVVQDVKTKKCTIVDKKPTTTETTVVGNGVYKTRVEAETGMKTVKVCTTN